MNIKAIISIIKKELKSYFNSPLAYILLCLFIGASYFFFFRSIFLSGEGTIRPYFELLIWFLLFLVPGVTMKTIAAERKDGTLEVMLAQPVTEFELLVGKFLADFIFIFGAILITLTLPISIAFGAKIDIGVVIAQYVGSFFLVGALVSIGMLTSSLSKNQTVALLSGIFAIFGLSVIGLDIIVLGLPYPINYIFQDLSLLSHFSNITRGVIDIRDVIYFLSVIAIFFGFTYLSFMARKLNKKSKAFKNLQMGIILVVVITVVINLLGSYVNFRLDFTSNKVYTLSQSTKDVLKDLDDKATIKFYASQELPPQVSSIYRDLKDSLEDYKSASGGKIQLVYKFPDKNSDAKTEAQEAGIQPVQFSVYKQDEFQAKEGYMGLLITYADKKEVIPFVQRTENFEYQLTSLIRKMTVDKKQKVAFTAGHGEKDASSNIRLINEELSKQYEVESLDSKKLNDKFLKTVNILVIASPKQEIPKKEQEAIKKYIDNGGKVLAMIESVDVNAQMNMMAQPVEKNFSEFFKQYGVTVNKDLLYDFKASPVINFGTFQAQYYFFLQALPESQASVITSGIESVTMPWASSVEAKDTKGKASVLLATSGYAGAQKDNFNASTDSLSSLSRKNLKKYDVAVQLTNLPKDGRMIVVGDSDFITDDFAQQSSEGVAFALNAIDWLGQDEVLIGIRSKDASAPKLVYSSDALKNFIRYFNNIGVVLIIAGIGFYRLAMRRRKTTEVYS